MALAQQKKRQRKANFTHAEILLLLQEISLEHELLNSSLTNDATNRRKTEIWRAIAEKVSSCGVAVRDVSEVRDKWKNLKSDVIKRTTEQNKTGGGLTTKPGPYDKQVLTLTNQVTSDADGTPNARKPTVTDNGHFVVVLNPSYSDNLPDASSCSDTSTVSRKRTHSQSESNSEPDPSHQTDIKPDLIQPDLSQVPDIKPDLSRLPEVQCSPNHQPDLQLRPDGRSDVPTPCTVHAKLKKRGSNQSRRAAAITMDITDVEKEYFQTQTQVNRAMLGILPLVERVLQAQEQLLILKARKLELELHRAEENKN